MLKNADRDSQCAYLKRPGLQHRADHRALAAPFRSRFAWNRKRGDSLDRCGNKPLRTALYGRSFQSKVLCRLTTRCSYFFGSSASAEHTKDRPIVGGWVGNA